MKDDIKKERLQKNFTGSIKQTLWISSKIVDRGSFQFLPV